MPVMDAALWALAELFEGAQDVMSPHFDPNEWEDLWLKVRLPGARDGIARSRSPRRAAAPISRLPFGVGATPAKYG